MFLLYVGTFGLVVSILVNLPDFDNKTLFLFFSGLILIGLGEWKRERYVSHIKPPNIYTGPAMLITERIQISEPTAIILEVIGGIVLLIGTLKFIF